MSCEFKNECPSYTGWCESPHQDFSKCIPFLLNAIHEEKKKSKKVLFLCDKWACEKCNSPCEHTSDVSHALNFKLVPGMENVFMEV
nr:MAG TPA: hypothetical protein [Caudoviricetes sp.]